MFVSDATAASRSLAQQNGRAPGARRLTPFDTRSAKSCALLMGLGANSQPGPRYLLRSRFPTVKDIDNNAIIRLSKIKITKHILKNIFITLFEELNNLELFDSYFFLINFFK